MHHILHLPAVFALPHSSTLQVDVGIELPWMKNLWNLLIKQSHLKFWALLEGRARLRNI